MISYLLGASLFGFSLNFFSVRATAISYLLLALVVLVARRKLIAANYKREGLLFLFLINLLAIGVSLPNEIYVNYLVKFVMMSVYVFCLAMLLKAGVVDKKKFLKIALNVALLHCAFFWLQLGVYLLTGNFIDFDSYIRESASEVLFETRALEGMLINIRGTGLFSEPSFLAMAILPAALANMLYDRKITLAVIFVYITAFATLSVAAILVVSLCVLLGLFFSQRVWLWRIVFSLAVILIAPFLFSYYQERVVYSSDYDVIGSRTLIFQELSDRPVSKDVFGNGFFWDESNLRSINGLSGANIRDSSFYVYFYYAAGIMLSIGFLGFLVYYFRRNPRYMLGILVLLLFKFHVMTGMLWMTFLLFYIAVNYESQEQKVS